jgi:hypothetical protein
MNAARKQALVPIVAGLRDDVAKYPLELALSDLHAYYFAGTFPGALQSIQAEAGKSEAKADVELNLLRGPGFFEATKQARVEKIVLAIDALTAAGAIALAKNPPVSNAERDTAIVAMDPKELRFSDEKVAKSMLKRTVVLDQRDDVSVGAWEDAVGVSD